MVIIILYFMEGIKCYVTSNNCRLFEGQIPFYKIKLLLLFFWSFKIYLCFSNILTKQLGARHLPLVTSARIAYFLSFDWVTVLQSNVDPTDKEPTEVVVRYWFVLPSCLWDTMTEPGWYLQKLVSYIHI